jgi:hypothetical protein
VQCAGDLLDDVDRAFGLQRTGFEQGVQESTPSMSRMVT